MAQRISGTPGTLGESVDPQELPATAAETTADNPWPLSLLSNKMKSYIDRMSSVWIEGQVVELNHRGKASYLTLRDTDVEMSLPVQIWKNVLDRTGAQLTEGSHVVANVKADFWTKTGRLTMRANDIRAVGLGELLARLERLKKQLAAEGLFDPNRKKRLPFLPNRIGLITGRDSDAQKDVVRNVHVRWPAAEFEIRNTAVQGPDAVPGVMKNLAELDADPNIDVIVIARGGGSMEDLLPFSNEALVRAVANASTPVVSAIGHEADRPILDEVADLRASTPTDAAKRIVPDVAEEAMGILNARALLDAAVNRIIDREQEMLTAVRSRPVLAEPQTMVDAREDELLMLRRRSLQAMTGLLNHGANEITHLRSQARSLSPLRTLERGYAVVQTEDGVAVRNVSEVHVGSPVHVRVAHGRFDAEVTKTENPTEEARS
ncbi:MULTISPECIES: exodeoxyribonuclease VII large subunit [Brevibacterium]|uniref:Exodeoxyribonuclease 7 large subunit n=3 Tax=Brevibacterium TaxID=1696 RepID=K9APF6_9MICO|nr:exodeoxyribonuclease VII large subunit [Brevibacterium casei]EKU49298.1 exodeoxyribonuclease VII large subunit [Brevibacterium casei S18]MBE4695654.1 exodeoxyribonuclease VII large subunit [Brevibacterium casei]MBY3578776.1 exodeoxyribonuclease VII large subunit [Brevibacterium casei]MCT1765723.1 exodeoxyribonuclease VII large subunit [Brevibacterium casei]MCT2182159.1 exodeoxyribonuclease VII large subunit [Brevibacterium casei]